MHGGRRVLTVLLVVALGPAGCTWVGANGPAQAVDDHFGDAQDVQTAVIMGDIDAARVFAARVADQARVTSLGPAASTYLEAFAARARAVAQSSDLITIARETAGLARSCGACHVALGHDVASVSGAAPPEGLTLEAHMVRHIWAVDRMWEGLIAPSVESWRVGATVLAEDPLSSRTLRSGSVSGPLAQAVHSVGLEAVETSDPYRWTELYGRLLTTCSGCHEALGVRVLR